MISIIAVAGLPLLSASAGLILGESEGAVPVSLASIALASIAPASVAPSSGEGTGQEGLSEVRSFTHAKHVPDAWLDPSEPERQRDCRGCHNYSESPSSEASSAGGTELRGPHDPQSVCSACHFNNVDNDYEFAMSASEDSFLTGLSALRTEGSLFQHSKHLGLECRECHAVDGDSIAAPILMPKTGGLPLCLECHGGDKPRQSTLRFMASWGNGTEIADSYKQDAVVKLKRGLVDTMNESPETGANQGGKQYVERFRHEDHILSEFLGGSTSLADVDNPDSSSTSEHGGNCGACHAPMFDAMAGFELQDGGEVFAPFDASAEECSSCHIADEARTPLGFVLGAEVQLSQTASTFSHRDHLNFVRPASAKEADPGSSEPAAGIVSIAAYDKIEGQGCGACHEYEAGSTEGYVLNAALGGDQAFAGCQECHVPSHSSATWAPAEHGEWWTHEDHGDWKRCTDCHEFGHENFAEQRVLATVTRRSSMPFRVVTQSHPHITVEEGESIHESCAECHRQPVETLPSRIQEATFDHASHLSANPTTEDCTVCHGTTVSGAERSEDIGTRALSSVGAGVMEVVEPDSLGLTYDPAACAECHLASAPVPAAPAPHGAADGAAADGGSRVVAQFSHKAHVGQTLQGGQEVGCADCHSYTPSASGEPLMIGTLESAKACTQCHSHSSGDRPDHARLSGGGITEQEVAACTTCHQTGVPAMGARTEIATAHVVDIADMGRQHHPSDQDCDSCHVPRQGLVAASVASTHSRVFAQRTFYREAPGEKLKPAIHRNGTRKFREDRIDCFACHWTGTLRGASSHGTAIPDPENSKERRIYGDDLRGFPGGHEDDFPIAPEGDPPR